MDNALFSAINGLAGHVDGIDDIFELIGQLTPYVLVALLLTMWFWPAGRATRDRYQWGAIAATLGASLALALNQVIIRLWARPRPFVARHATLLLAPSRDPSFPSDHATFGFAVAVAIVCVSRRFGLPALLMAALLAFSRVYTGEHYPGDVLAGALIGGTVTCGVLALRPLLLPRLDPLLRFGRRVHLA